MGNYISKISKDRLLSFEESTKNATSTEKGKVRLGLNRLTGGTYTRIHFIKNYSKTLDPLQTGVWWKRLFKNGLGV